MPLPDNPSARGSDERPAPPSRRSAITAIVLVTVVLTAAAGLTAARIESDYLATHIHFFDPVGYSIHNARLHERLTEEGRWALAWKEWWGNDRHPLRTVPLILLAPEALASPVGHILTALPAFGIFLGLLGWTVYRRSGHVPYALASMAFAVAIPGLYHPRHGLGAYWADLPAAFLAGGALLCLVNADGARRMAWLAGFAFLASLTALCRYVAGGYLFVMAAPVLALDLVRRWREERSLLRAVGLPLLCIGGVLGTVAGYYLAAHAWTNLSFYSQFGNALKLGVVKSALFTGGAWLGYLKAPHLVLMAGLAVTGLGWLGTRPVRWREALRLAWYPLAHLLFLACVLQAVGHKQATYFAIPPLVVLAVTPVPWDPGRATPRRARVLSGILLGLALALGAGYAARQVVTAGRADAQDQDRKRVSVELAQAIHEQGGRLVIDDFSSSRAWMTAMETFYRHGELPLPTGLLAVFPSYWPRLYPGLSPEAICRAVYEKASGTVDVAIVLSDPGQVDRLELSPQTAAIARHVSATMRCDPRWERVRVVESVELGPLAVYRRHTPPPGDYRGLLQRKTMSTPQVTGD